MKISHILTGAVMGVLIGCGAAMAQAAAPAPAAAAAAAGPVIPNSKAPDVKTVGDWLVRCFQITSPSPCDMFQELDDQRTRQRVLSFSLTYVASVDKHGIQITVPLEVSIPKGLQIVTDSFTSPVLKYRMCDRSGCFVQTPLDNGVVGAMAKSGPEGRVRIFADNGKQYEIKFSLKGFAAAHDAMVEQNRAKAKTPAPAAAAPAATP